VSRGAFYRHFQSFDDALVELTSELLSDIVATAGAVFADVADPLLGSTLGPQLLLYRAGMDRPWAQFVASTNLFLGDPAVVKVMQRAIRAGRSAGVFRFGSLTVATDAVLGILLAGVRQLADSQEPLEPYVAELSLLLLRSLGAAEAAAAAAVAAARARIAEIGPGQLPWWRAG
jgi:AcrR family transcriptional regulator